MCAAAPACCVNARGALLSEREFPMQFVDKALARRLESVEEIAAGRFCMREAFQKTRPEIGAAEEEICGGHMIFRRTRLADWTGDHGVDWIVRSHRSIWIEWRSSYRDHKAPPRSISARCTMRPCLKCSKERGYAIAELNNVPGTENSIGPRLISKLAPARPRDPAPVRLKRRRSRERSSRARSFLRVHPRHFVDWIHLAHTRWIEALAFAASIDGKLVACGVGLTIPEHKVFALCGAGTLAGYRGRGLQTALLQARMATASDAGCEYAGGSHEWRNNLASATLEAARVSCRV